MVATAYSQESNRYDECLKRTILDMFQTKGLNVGGTPHKLWEDDMNTSCYIRNRFPMQSSKEDCIRFELKHDGKPDFVPNQIFRRNSDVHTPAEKQGEFFGPRAREGILVR